MRKRIVIHTITSSEPKSTLREKRKIKEKRPDCSGRFFFAAAAFWSLIMSRQIKSCPDWTAVTDIRDL